MPDFLKVIRYKNLLFIAFIQLVMQKVVIVPILQTFGFQSSFDNTLLFLLIASTVFIAAGGYVLTTTSTSKLMLSTARKNNLLALK